MAHTFKCMVNKVGVILINYKDYATRFLSDCRDSLYVQTYPRDRFNVYIVDNATSGETRAEIASLYPQAVVIGTDGNGWGHGNNVGMRRAFDDGCDAVVLANMDTIFDAHWLEELLTVAGRGDVGIAQSKVVLYPPRDGMFYLNSTGNLFHFLGFGFTRDYNVPAASYTDEAVTDIGYASGVALCIRKDVARRVGFCDEYYFMYHDDIELSLKVKLVGLHVVLAPRSVVYHKYEFNRSIRQLYYMERNRYLMLFTFLKPLTLLLIFPALLFMECGMWLFAVAHGWTSTKWLVTLYFFTPSAWRYIFAARKKLCALRTISDRALLRDAVGKVEFQEIDNPLLRYAGNPMMNAYWQIARRLLVW